MEARNRYVPDWFNRIRTGQVRLPRFQRLESWTHSKVTSLLESVLRGLPGGAAEDFLKSVRMSAIFARDSNGIVRVQTSAGDEFSPGKMIIATRSDEVGENVGEIDTLVEGEPAKIAFNGKYLTDVLGILKSRQVSLETTSPSSPGVLKPLSESSYIHVIMPMFVQW